MKLTAIPVENKKYNINTKYQSNKNPVSKVDLHKPNNFVSIYNISFTSDSWPLPPVTSYSSDYWKEQEEKRKKEEAYKQLEITDPVKWAQTWDYSTRRAYYDKLYQEEISTKWTRIGNKKIKARYDLQFSQEQTKVMNILQGVKGVQDKLDSAEAKEKANKIREEQIKNTEKVRDRINTRLSDPNANIDASIAGYQFQKELLRDGFIAPIIEEQINVETYKEMLDEPYLYTDEQLAEAKLKAYGQNIPPSILFYGCFGTGKNTFARALAVESGCYYEEFSSTREEYGEFIARVQKESKERYEKTGQRTVAVINEVERYLNNSYAFREPQNEAEARKFETISDNVSEMRGILDHCSELPQENGIRGAVALSFFFTTNYPKKMTEIGLIERAGRMPLVIPVEPATEEDLKEVLKFHIKRVMPEENGFDVDAYDFSKILEKLELSDKKGCYSNDRIRQACDEIRATYDKNPNGDFAKHLEDMILNNKTRMFRMRDISPRIYEQYYDDFETISGGY